MNLININSYLNNKGISGGRYKGSLEHTDMSIPSDLVIGKSFYAFNLVDRIDMKFDHIICEGQTVELNISTNNDVNLYFLANASWGDYSESLIINSSSNKKNGKLNVSFINRKYWSGGLTYPNELIGFEIPYLYDRDFNRLEAEAGFWVSSLSTGFKNIDSITLPDNPYLHIWAIGYT